ncbi:hypothetical protein QBC33DRAFT_618204 [Phialemonium atrogriseum]|uniref:HMG box domain-containing protein n=1 Tax=Phialemonium atrogriseum TaxID=1093897 RepID=A0AAJ0C3A6_9PEZI|nr:uncharacterized protein QBC33DRAFT_618204 [Phialemonium atrogriseum]KAK1769373.1 hypothetical protein QBC33DRAFT_618204 [Phialemonium atrogriseum]
MSPTTSVPPALPPSVEEAYRRKCLQLKQRTTEVEEANDAARLRLNRLKRQVEKMRLERAFLLEQIARRTSTNVEDSEGSPSPPPTPKEKPLRIKRGHRKASLLPNADTPPIANSSLGNTQNPQTQSPSSDAFSHSHADASQSQAQKGAGAATTNGTAAKPPAKPLNGFELYCTDARPALLKEREKLAAAAAAEDDGDNDKNNKEEEAAASSTGGGANVSVEEELARSWRDLPESQREEFQARYERELAAGRGKAEEERGGSADGGDRNGDGGDGEGEGEGEGEEEEEALLSINAVGKPADESTTAEDKDTPRPQDEDVDMVNYDTDQETQAEKQED